MTDDAASQPPMGTRREILMGAACFVAAGTAVSLQPRRKVDFLRSAKIEALVPPRFAGWTFVAASGLVLPPQDQTADKTYNQILARTYANAAGAQIMLLIAYNASQDGVVQVHRPEVCYPAGGYRLSVIEDHDVPLRAGLSMPGRYILAENSIRREEIIYWTRLGDYFPRSWLDQRWAVFAQNLKGNIPDGMLARISSITPGVGQSELDHFARDLYASIATPMRHLLAGNAIDHLT